MLQMLSCPQGKAEIYPFLAFVNGSNQEIKARQIILSMQDKERVNLLKDDVYALAFVANYLDGAIPSMSPFTSPFDICIQKVKGVELE